MSLKKLLGKVLIYVFLEAGALCGVPISPEEIERLMQMSDTKVVCVTRTDSGDGKDSEPQ